MGREQWAGNVRPFSAAHWHIRSCALRGAWLPIVAGLGAAPVYGLGTLVAERLRPDYDPIRQHISDLGVGPLAWVQNGTTVALGLLLLAFARGLGRAPRAPRGAALAPVTLAVSGVGAMLIGLFPQGSEHGRGGNFWVHSLAFWLSVAALLLTAALLAGGWRHDARWRGWARATGWYAGFAVLAVGVVLAGPLSAARWGGALERLLIGGGLLWLEVLAAQLLVCGMAPTPPGRLRACGVRLREVCQATRRRLPLRDGAWTLSDRAWPHDLAE